VYCHWWWQRRRGAGGCSPSNLDRNLFHWGKFCKRTIGNSGRKFKGSWPPKKFDVLLRPWVLVCLFWAEPRYFSVFWRFLKIFDDFYFLVILMLLGNKQCKFAKKSKEGTNFYVETRCCYILLVFSLRLFLSYF